MEKSGSRYTSTGKQLIIDRPDLQSWRQKFFSNFLTLLFWGLWIFLWLPLVTLIGWFFFSYQFQEHMVVLHGYIGFMQILGIYALVIFVMGGTLIIWAKYNHFRFRGMDRRRHAPLISPVDLAEYSGLPASRILHWRELPIVTVHHDEAGHISRVFAHSIMPSPSSEISVVRSDAVEEEWSEGDVVMAQI